MKLSIFHLLFRTPGLRRYGRQISPEAFFALCRQSVNLSLRFNAHTRRYLRPLRAALESELDENRLRDIAVKHLVYRRYSDNLPYLWQGQVRRKRKFFRIEGQEHIKAATTEGKGAIILCSHLFGINRLIAPVIAAFGYPIWRVGGWDEDAMVQLWGDHEQRSWKKIYLSKDRWKRLRAAKQIATALNDNELVLMSMANRSSGSPDSEVSLFGRKFYVDPALLPLFEHLDTAVLPCFGLCDERGRLRIIVHAPLRGSSDEKLRAYCKLFSEYLSKYPEFCHFWKPLAEQRPRW